MSLLKTVVTYHQPSEAEIDKAFLESHGINVCLLNGNTSRNELGAPFYIQLQVSDEQYEQAEALLRDANPQRFGSVERVAELDRAIKRAFVRFAVVAIPVGVALYFVIPRFDPASNDHIEHRAARRTDLRLAGALIGAVWAGVYAMTRKNADDKKP